VEKANQSATYLLGCRFHVLGYDSTHSGQRDA